MANVLGREAVLTRRKAFNFREVPGISVPRLRRKLGVTSSSDNVTPIAESQEASPSID